MKTSAFKESVPERLRGPPGTKIAPLPFNIFKPFKITEMLHESEKSKSQKPRLSEKETYTMIEACYYGGMTYSRFYKIRSEYGIYPIKFSRMYHFYHKDVMVAMQRLITSEVNTCIIASHFNKIDNASRTAVYAGIMVGHLLKYRHIDQTIISEMVNQAVDNFITLHSKQA